MVTNRVYKVLATNGTQMTNLADTGVSEYLVIDEAGNALTATSTLSKDSKFQVVVNSPNGGKVFSDKIRVGDITAYEKQAYTAKVEQVVTVTLATPVAGISYSVSIIDRSDKEILQARQNKRTYTIVAGTGETVTTLGDKFRTQINADTASSVTASGTTTLVLTAKAVSDTADLAGEYPAQYYFEVFSSSLDDTVYPIGFPKASGTVVYTTAPNFGSGRFSQVRKLEQLGIGYTGITNRTKFPVPAGDFLSVAGTNYDAIIIEFDNRHDTNTVVEGEKRAPLTLAIFVTTGSGTAISAILDNIAPIAGVSTSGYEALKAAE